MSQSPSTEFAGNDLSASISRKLVALRIFPIKGAHAVSIKEAVVTPIGLADDRRYMVVDQNGLFQSQRKIPQMTQIEVALLLDGLQVQFPKLSRLFIPRGKTQAKMKVKVWATEFEAWHIDPAIDQWFSDALHTNVKFVWMGDDCPRKIDSLFSDEDRSMNCADASPITLNNVQSLQAIANSYPEKLPIDRFRNNITIDGTDAWEEESWQKVQIGSAKFKVLLPCGRCQVPSIDQETGKVPKNPIAVLETIRKVRNNGNFGIHMIPLETGIIALGNEIFPLN